MFSHVLYELKDLEKFNFIYEQNLGISIQFDVLISGIHMQKKYVENELYDVFFGVLINTS
jgi:hypothetical protein